MLLPFAAYGLTRLVFKLTTSYSPKSFVSLAYGYLPLVLAANLAYYLSLGLGEGGQILSVGLATFGLSGEGVPVYVAHPAVIAFLQSAVLVFGALSSIVLTQKIVRQSLRLMWPQHLSAIALVALLWPLLITH